MKVKIGINGFGRIGRLVLRIALDDPDRFELCGINLRNADTDYMAYLAKYDTVHGRLRHEIEAADGALIIDGKKIQVFSETDVANIAWDSCGATYIVESTGAFNKTEAAKGHLVHGAKKVVLTAPAKDEETPTFVMGVNHLTYRPEFDVVSNASCTTNCLAPLAKVVHERFGIQQGLMSTIHAATAKQKTVDARAGSDYRAARSVFNNIIPTSTGAAKAVGKVIPELKGKLTGMSFRIPASNVSVVDFTAKLEKKTTYEAICQALDDASANELKGIMCTTRDAVVSQDMLGESHTCIVDHNAGIMLGDDFVKLVAWYDNEWGYSCKVLDLLYHIATVCEK